MLLNRSGDAGGSPRGQQAEIEAKSGHHAGQMGGDRQKVAGVGDIFRVRDRTLGETVSFKEMGLP